MPALVPARVAKVASYICMAKLYTEILAEFLAFMSAVDAMMAVA